MDPRQLFADERLGGVCVYCGVAPSTRDHVPPKILLDEPYPANLPIVEACESCNNRFSDDERYLACLIDCVISGTVESNMVNRPKVGRTLEARPSLATSIAAGRQETMFGDLVWLPEENRVRNMVLKLAQGHIAYEYSEPRIETPDSITFVPLCSPSKETIHIFESVPTEIGWPEIGSRAFCRAAVQYPELYLDYGWLDIQPGRYRYAVFPEGVRIVLSEYLACEVLWN